MLGGEWAFPQNRRFSQQLKNYTITKPEGDLAVIMCLRGY